MSQEILQPLRNSLFSVPIRDAVVVMICAAISVVPIAHAQPDSPALPVSEKEVQPAAVEPPTKAPSTGEAALPTMTELISSYRAMPFAERCEIVVRRTRANQSPVERRATAFVRCDARTIPVRVRLELGELTIGLDASRILFVSAKDSKSYVSGPRRESVVNSLSEWVPPLPLFNILIGCEATFPDDVMQLRGLSWTATRQGNHVVFAADQGNHHLELHAAGDPLRLVESRVVTGTAENEQEVRVMYQPAVFSDKDLSVDVAGRDAKRTLSELAWATPESAAQPRARIANITGNTADYKPWSLSDAIAARKSAGESPFAVGLLMFVGPLGIEARVIDEDVARATVALRNASTELRRAAVDDPTVPRLLIEPLAVYEVSTFEREAPKKLAESWAAAANGSVEGSMLRWSLSPASTIDKYAKGAKVAVMLVDAEMNLIGTVDVSGDAADVQARVIQLIRGR